MVEYVAMASPRNHTIRLSPEEEPGFLAACRRIGDTESVPDARDFEAGGAWDGAVLLHDALEVLPRLPPAIADLAVIDPPYNLDKDFHGVNFRSQGLEEYGHWLRGWLPDIHRILRPGGSLYLCSDWRSSTSAHQVLADLFTVRNRITWAREKGRGAKSNWKSLAEDIWFCTKGNDYHFDVDSVKLRRAVVAPYRTKAGEAKDWIADGQGQAWRDTHPGNIWTDLTVPFWSMPENTCHPTQKPEKLIARLVLASSRHGDLIFDPFAGSGTTLAVARKLGRRWLGIECNPHYAALIQKRLELAAGDQRIQGYDAGVFWERNSGR
jgi:site-specific DNA-methyltransferase (adenine-specific)